MTPRLARRRRARARAPPRAPRRPSAEDPGKAALDDRPGGPVPGV